MSLDDVSRCTTHHCSISVHGCSYFKPRFAQTTIWLLYEEVITFCIVQTKLLVNVRHVFRLRGLQKARSFRNLRKIQTRSGACTRAEKFSDHTRLKVFATGESPDLYLPIYLRVFYLVYSIANSTWSYLFGPWASKSCANDSRTCPRA